MPSAGPAVGLNEERVAAWLSQLPESIGSHFGGHHLKRAAGYYKECTKHLICKLSVIFNIVEFSKGLSTTAVDGFRPVDLKWWDLILLSTHYWCTDHLHWLMQTGGLAVWLTDWPARRLPVFLTDQRTGSLTCCQTYGCSAVCLHYWSHSRELLNSPFKSQ